MLYRKCSLHIIYYYYFDFTTIYKITLYNYKRVKIIKLSIKTQENLFKKCLLYDEFENSVIFLFPTSFPGCTHHMISKVGPKSTKYFSTLMIFNIFLQQWTRERSCTSTGMSFIKRKECDLGYLFLFEAGLLQ